MASVTLPTVAAKRGRQTAAQGLGIDVVVALALAAATFLPGVSSWEDVKLGWAAWLLLVCKSVVQAVVSWVLRRFGDQSGFADQAHEVVEGEVSAPAVEPSEPDIGLADPGLPEDADSAPKHSADDEEQTGDTPATEQ